MYFTFGYPLPQGKARGQQLPMRPQAPQVVGGGLGVRLFIGLTVTGEDTIALLKMQLFSSLPKILLGRKIGRIHGGEVFPQRDGFLTLTRLPICQSQGIAVIHILRITIKSGF